MGYICVKPTNSDTSDNEIRANGYKEIGEREEINEEKFIVRFKIIEESENIKKNSPIELEVIHVSSVDSTMTASRKYIDEGNKIPFIYNTEIQTHGKGKGSRNWAGSIVGNIYTSSSIPTNMVKNEINSNDTLVKLTAISIIQKLEDYSKNQFFLKYPNDIICKDRKKLGGIIVELYKDFYIIGFGINIVDKPEQKEIRKQGLLPCFVNEHLTEEKKSPNALELSIEITKQIIFNLRNTKEEIGNLYTKYIQKGN